MLIGARRSGKSTLLELIRRQLLNDGVPENAMLYLNFESSSHMEAMLALVDNMASLPVMTTISRESATVVVANGLAWNFAVLLSVRHHRTPSPPPFRMIIHLYSPFASDITMSRRHVHNVSTYLVFPASYTLSRPFMRARPDSLIPSLYSRSGSSLNLFNL